MFRVKTISITLLILFLMAAFSVSAYAGEILSYKRQLALQYLPSDDCRFKTLHSITIDVPGPGVVVISATGMAYFKTDRYPSLTLSPATEPAEKGLWVYTLTPGEQPYQAYSVSMVFKVSRKGKKTYYVNGASCDGGAGTVEIQTGVLTAEFFPGDNVEDRSEVVEHLDGQTDKDLRTNAP